MCLDSKLFAETRKITDSDKKPMATNYSSQHAIYLLTLLLCQLNHCHGQTECNANEPCHIICDNQNDNCHRNGYTVQCPSDYPCRIDCSGSASCYRAKIECNSSSECSINCNGPQTCYQMDIDCGNAPCHVSCDGNLVCRFLSITWPDNLSLNTSFICDPDGDDNNPCSNIQQITSSPITTKPTKTPSKYPTQQPSKIPIKHLTYLPSTNPIIQPTS